MPLTLKTTPPAAYRKITKVSEKTHMEDGGEVVDVVMCGWPLWIL